MRKTVDERLWRIWCEGLQTQKLAVCVRAADDKAFARRLGPAGAGKSADAGAAAGAGKSADAGAAAEAGASGDADAGGATGAGASEDADGAADGAAVVWLKVAPHIFAERNWWRHSSLMVKIQHLLRSIQFRHPHVVFSGDCVLAALGLQLDAYEGVPLAITQATRSQSSRRSNRTTTWTHVKNLESQIDIHAGIRHVCLERIICDVVSRTELTRGVGLLFEAMRVGYVSRESMMRFIRAQKHVRGIRNLKVLLRVLCLDADNAGEAKLSAMIQHLGFARPVLQRPFYNPRHPDSPYRADMSWQKRSGAVCVLELDGIVQKRVVQLDRLSAGQLVQREIERTSILMNEGCDRIARTTYDIVRRPEDLCNLLGYLGVPRVRSWVTGAYRVLKRRRIKQR